MWTSRRNKLVSWRCYASLPFSPFGAAALLNTVTAVYLNDGRLPCSSSPAAPMRWRGAPVATAARSAGRSGVGRCAPFGIRPSARRLFSGLADVFRAWAHPLHFCPPAGSMHTIRGCDARFSPVAEAARPSGRPRVPGCASYPPLRPFPSVSGNDELVRST